MRVSSVLLFKADQDVGGNLVAAQRCDGSACGVSHPLEPRVRPTFEDEDLQA
jgi:hypothetical protein